MPHSSVGAAAPTLRPYQREMIAAAQRELARERSTLLVSATGSGKTFTFSELIRLWTSHGDRTLVVVHRDELIRQARRKLEELGLHPDVEKGSQRASTLAKVVLASVQSLRGKRLQRWARNHFARIVVDEAHHALAPGYRDILDHFDEAKVLGVTATPVRADGKALGDVFATVAYRYEIRRAIAEGYLVPIVARRIVVDSVDLSTVATRAGDFAQDQLAEVMADERALRGTAVPLLDLARDRSTIAFCVDVDHAEKLAATLNRLRPGCARMVCGETPEHERERILDAFARGELQFVTNVDVLTEGYDAPRCSCVANCRPTKSWARFVQGAGRGLRPSPETGKRDCLLLDFTGTAGKHRLAGPADCLAGAGTDIPDDVRDEIDRLLGTAQLELEAVIAQADTEASRRRDALRISAVVRYHAEHVDPFLGEDDGRGPASQPQWRGEPPSAAQLAALEKDGVTLSKLPTGFTRADAWNLLARFRARSRAGLCSYAQAKLLVEQTQKHCRLDTATLSKARAGKLIGLLKANGYGIASIANEPEVRAALALRRGETLDANRGAA